MKQTLSAVLFISMIFFSCRKETSLNGNQPPGSVERGRPPGKGKPLPPVANAGTDQTIILPTNPNKVTLDGSRSTDPNNDISSYFWRNVSGPSSPTIANPGSAITEVTNLVEGTYQFELKVTDVRGSTGIDKVQVTVMVDLPPTPPPCTTCKIVFVSARDGNNEIYTSNTDGSNMTRLTNDPGDDGQPKWSPDGTRIAFSSNRDGNYDIYIMNADGSNVVQRTFSMNADGYIQGLTWSPDGTKIAFSEYMYLDLEDVYTSSIYAVNATSGLPLLLLNHGWNPAWSPDGTKIALRDGADIYTINSDGTGLALLAANAINFDYPSWSPDGTKIAMFGEYFDGSAEGFYYYGIYTINPNGSGLTTSLFSGAAWGGTSWSGDGTAIAYTSWSGSTSNVSWVMADGSAGGTIVTNGWDADWKR